MSSTTQQVNDAFKKISMDNQVAIYEYLLRTFDRKHWHQIKEMRAKCQKTQLQMDLKLEALDKLNAGIEIKGKLMDEKEDMFLKWEDELIAWEADLKKRETVVNK